MMPPRSAGLVLVTAAGAVVGSLPAVAVSTPWWQDVEPVVRAVRQRYGVEVVVLRLLQAELPQPPGGRVIYLAEVAEPVPTAEAWSGRLDEQPLRLAYARPGGPSADLAWAESVLVEYGLRPAGRPVQIRTWNLSSVWRIPVEGRWLWLKVVPPFLAHEGALLRLLNGAGVPRLLDQVGSRSLLEDIPGADLHHAELPQLLAMVTLLVELQRACPGRVDELLALGLPDWRAASLGAAIVDVLERTARELSREDRATLDGFVDGLAERFTNVAACGLPDTLVHGDFWPGNVRGDGLALTLFDWGDSCVGQPLLDQCAFFDRIPSQVVTTVREHWVQRWRMAVPGSDPGRASDLLAPVAAARLAVVYRRFLDNIEPDERAYHRHDPAELLRRTASLVRAMP
jgi:Ser/Thr protein kinase RdoA (MazF antagonist)